MRVLLRDCLKISKLALAENEQSVYLHIDLLNKNLDQEKNESEKSSRPFYKLLSSKLIQNFVFMVRGKTK